jgi:TetR/AcrR family transcriptional regulator, transcriptional repressor for nem operon
MLGQADREATMRKGELTRERIIAAAAPIFNQHGYEGTSIHALMEATGLEKGGIYRHFSNKEELAAEAFRFSLNQIRKIRTDDLEQISGSLARLHYVIERFTETPSPIAGGCPLMNAAIDCDDGNPLIRDLAAQGLRQWRNRIAKIAEDGIAAGEISSTADPRRIANVIISALEGALMLARMERTRTPLCDVRVTLSDWLDSLGASKTKPTTPRVREKKRAVRAHPTT